MKNQGVWEASRTLVFDQRVPRSTFQFGKILQPVVGAH
jgi:hypothetical protein